MHQAKYVMANYARNKAVKIDIYESVDSLQPVPKNHIVLKVTNLIKHKTQQNTISSEVNQIYLHKTKNNTTEDNFLRNLYRIIQELTEKVTT